MQRLRLFFCLVILGFSVTSTWASEGDSNDFLVSYIVNWSDTSVHFSGCNSQQFSNERHFLLGNCPTGNSINLYYLSTALMHYTAANILPKRYSRILKDNRVNFQMVVFGDTPVIGMTLNF